MGLTGALYSSSTSIKVSSEAFDIISNNIANANNENYIKRVISTEAVAIDGIGAGVKIASLKARADEFLKVALDSQQSIIGQSRIIKDYYARLNILVGDPNQQNHVAAYLNNFLSSLAGLMNAPDVASSRQNAVNNGINLAKKISELAFEVQRLRLEVDQEIKVTVEKINEKTRRIKELNALSRTFLSGSQSDASIAEEKAIRIKELADLINIRVFTNSNDEMNISTSSGKSLLDENLYLLEYSPANSVRELADNIPLRPLQKFIISDSGVKGGAEELISGGAEGEITSYIEGGVLSGLQKLRDDELPRILERLDNLAYGISQQINKFHNTGGGYKPASSYVGTFGSLSTERRDWSGKVRIAVVDQDGFPVKMEPERSSDNRLIYRSLKPLDLDLGKLINENNDGPGRAISVNEIINEINQYFQLSPLQSRVRMGDIQQNDGLGSGGMADIKIVSTQSNTSASGTFSFDFELDNDHRNDYKFEVINLSVNNGATVTAKQSGAFFSKAGERERTRNNGLNVIDFNGGGGGSYTITARVKITDAVTDEVSISDITYIVNDSETNIFNKRFAASSATGDNVAVNGVAGARFIAPQTTQYFLKAATTDENGQIINDGKFGYLSLHSSDPAKYRIVIDDMPITKDSNLDKESFHISSENGLSSNVNIEATNRGFSHYFGLNNFFKEGPQKRNSAYNMQVREDIASVANGYDLMSVASLRKTFADKDILITKGFAQANGTLKFTGVITGGSITVNGLAFNLTNTPALPNDIDISSGDAAIITQNIVDKLNSSSSEIANFGVDLASYSVTSNDPTSITITHKSRGETGNNFTIAVNLVGASANLNNTTNGSNLSGTLIGGNNTQARVKQVDYSYNLGRGDKQAAEAMFNSRNIVTSFKSILSKDVQIMTINAYANQNVISYIANSIKNAESNYANDNLRYKEFLAKYREGSGVNIDEELINLVKFQASYNASSKVIGTVAKMFDSLMNAI